MASPPDAAAPLASPPADTRPPPPAHVRWTVLTLVSLALFGNYYTYDSIGVLADILQKSLGYTDSDLADLNAAYNVSGIGLVLVGGILVDRLGARRATVVFSAICLLGAVLTAVSPRLPVMVAGRLVLGLGSESLIVAVTTLLGQWFSGRALGLAFGLNLSLARFGSFGADFSPTVFKPLYDAGWQQPLWLAAGLSLLSLVTCGAYALVERDAERRYQLGRPPPPDRIVWRELLTFDRSYWYVVGLCVTFYSVIFPFRSTFSIKYFQHAHHLDLAEAGRLNSWVFLAAIFFTPFFGWLVDRVGRRAFFMACGTALLALSFTSLALGSLALPLSTAFLGIAFSLVPATLWPAVAQLVTPARLGTAYGAMTLLENVGWLLANKGAGWLNDGYQASEANPGGYTPMLVLFFVLSLFGFVFALALRLRETGPHGHGLERGRAPSP
jgi:MFS family permease